MTYKPFGYDTIPEHLQGYRILPKHIADQFPNLNEPWTKAQIKMKCVLARTDCTYKDYHGPFKGMLIFNE